MGINMEEKTAIVKSPSRTQHFREGEGFSIPEIKKAGKSIKLLKELNIGIDYFRKSAHERNIEQLKTLEPPKKKKEKREPFVKKEKKRTPFKEKKPKEKPISEKKISEKKPEKKEIIKKKKPKEIPEEKVIPLTELYGLGPKTQEKLNALGVHSVNDLVKEDPSELATLVTGASEDSIKDWIEEGKKLLEG
jgi:predicted flap endonuclease-1-like 5' DNA nuclease